MFKDNKKIKLFNEKNKEEERLKLEEQKRLEKINKTKEKQAFKQKNIKDKKDKEPFYMQIGKGIGFVIRMLVTVIISILDSLQWIFVSAVVTLAVGTILHFKGFNVVFISDIIEKFL